MADDDEEMASNSDFSDEAADVDNEVDNSQVVASSKNRHDDNQWSFGPECLPQLLEEAKESDMHVEPCTNGATTLLTGPLGSLKLDQAQSLSDVDITFRNRVILTSLENSTVAIEAAKTWDVGSLLGLFNDESRKEIEAVITKNINGL